VPGVLAIAASPTSLAQILTAAALNLYRLDAWWTGTPLGTTRVSHYEQLVLGLAA
jgi:hypothetical protein